MTAEKKVEVKVEPKVKEEEPPILPPPPVPAATPAPVPPVIPPAVVSVPPPSVPAAPALHRENSSSSMDKEDHFYSNSNGQLDLPPSFNFPPPSFPHPPPTEFFGGWHQPFWNASASSWLPPQQQQSQPVEAPSTTSYNTEVPPGTESDSKAPLLDLDTRIELLLKGKVNAGLTPPAFLNAMTQLQLDGSSPDNTNNSSRSSSRNGELRGSSNRSPREDGECGSPPISPPPSPFISRDSYREHYRATHVVESDRASPRNQQSAVDLDDEMSLSSLSSGEEKILNSGQDMVISEPAKTDTLVCQPPLPPHFVAPFYPPPHPSADPYFAWRGMYGAAPPGSGGAYPSPANVFPPTAGAAYPAYNYPPPNGYPPFMDMTQQASVYSSTGASGIGVSGASSHSNQQESENKDPHAHTIE